MKICNKCKIEKELSKFHKNKNKKDGHNSHCKKCQHEYYIKNRLSRILKGIKQRCENPKCKEYKWYGNKGVMCYLTLNDLKYIWNRDKHVLFICKHCNELKKEIL